MQEPLDSSIIWKKFSYSKLEIYNELITNNSQDLDGLSNISLCYELGSNERLGKQQNVLISNSSKVLNSESNYYNCSQSQMPQLVFTTSEDLRTPISGDQCSGTQVVSESLQCEIVQHKEKTGNIMYKVLVCNLA